MKNRARWISGRLAAAAAVAAVLLAGPSATWAQQKQRVSFEAPSSAKLTQQHAIDVGDVPGHQIRVWELRRVFDGNGPVIGGARVKEQVNHGMSDYTDLNGLSTFYATFTLETGDRFFCRGGLTAQSLPAATGKKVLKYTSACAISSGTGKLQGIRGVVTGEGTSDLASGANQSKQDIEYWIDATPSSAPSKTASSEPGR